MAEQIEIDDTYTCVFDDGRTGILRHGEPWLGEGSTTPLLGAKAWIAAVNEIEELRRQVSNLQIAVERAYKFANTLESEDDEANAWRLRAAMKDRS